MKPPTTLAQLLQNPRSSAPAIIAPSYDVVVSYTSLAEQVERLASQFLGAGFKAGDTVAVILPNGLEFLVGFLALTRARLVASPINPADKAEEMRFFITAGQAKALITGRDNATAAQIAASLGLPLWTPQVDHSGVVTVPQLPAGTRHSAEGRPATTSRY